MSRCPTSEPENEVLASLWARAKVDHLMDKDLAGIQRGKPDPAIKEEILGLGLRYQLLTQFTSFVAVEHLRITEGGQVRTVRRAGRDARGRQLRGRVRRAGWVWAAWRMAALPAQDGAARMMLHAPRPDGRQSQRQNAARIGFTSEGRPSRWKSNSRRWTRPESRKTRRNQSSSS